MISIIIRAKNEERWIGSCLEAISRQTRKDYEIVLVDNNSTDRTVDKSLQYGVTLVTISEFFPGAAINRGIEASSGKVLVCLSGHCIPVDEFWLENLVLELADETLAGIYGRQEPLAFTPDLDKRDLLITFGLDPRVQTKDSFFHNANSAFRREVWEKFPFDEKVRNIEDRIWANQVLEAGYKLRYEPSASVYHHHGIHQNGDPVRCSNIIRILESFGPEETKTLQNKIDARSLNVVIVIPIREEGLREVSGKPLYEFAIAHAKHSALAKIIVVSTDDEVLAERAESLGVDQVLMRSPEESRFDVILEMLMQTSLTKLETQGTFPDVMVMLEPTFPFRDPSLVDQLLCEYVDGGFDTVIPARTEYNSCWMEEEGQFHRVDSGHVARQFKQPFFTGLKGLGCVISPSTLRRGELLGDNVGLYAIQDPFQGIEVRTDADQLIAETILSSPRFDKETPRDL